MTIDRLDELIDSLLEMEIRPADLVELAGLVGGDETAGARFERALRAERTLRRGAEAAGGVAARVSIAPSPAGDQGARRPARPRRRLAMGASWALTAASLAVAAGLALRSGDLAAGGGGVLVAAQEAGAAPSGPVPAVRNVVGELPLVAVGVRPSGAGGLEVLYVRPQIEQTEISDIYRFARDEHGRPVPIRTEVLASAGREAM